MQTKHQQPQTHRTNREIPKNRGLGINLRAIPHKFTVPFHHKGKNFIIGRTCLELPMKKCPQITGNRGIRISNVLVLALRAAKFLTQLIIPGLEGRRTELISLDNRQRL
jgi:hypothetical protein